ncbi:MAG: N4-gp56 family major capsid protein [Planctomycetota bacterium]|jgi:N4-gp56 family major capsid protein
MGQYTWTNDVPSGTLKSHEISEKLYLEAVGNTKAFQFAQPIENFGKGKGDTVSLTRIAAIAEPTSDVLVEGTKISEDAYSVSQTSVTVKERGRAIPLTNLVKDLSNYDLGSSVENELRRQMTLSLDSNTYVAMRTTKAKYVPTGAASSTKETSSATVSATASSNIGVYHIKEIYDLLYDTYKTPPFEGEDYIGIFRHKSVAGLRDDDDWIEWQKYTSPSGLEKNEVGKIANIRIIDTNHGNTDVSNPKGLLLHGTSDVLGEGFVFGEDAIAVAMVQEPELRMKAPQDYGRDQGVAWYAIYELLSIHTNATEGQTRIMHVGSAA